MIEIVRLKKNPPVSDIPGWFRKLADDYEKGDFPGVDYFMVIWPAENQEDDWPTVAGVGLDPGDLARVGLLTEAIQFLTIHKVARQSSE